MLALLFLDIHAKHVDEAMKVLVDDLTGMTEPVKPLFICEAFGFYETSLVVQYPRPKKLTSFINENIKPLRGLQRVERYALVEPVWLASKELIEGNPPGHKIHAYMFIQPEEGQTQTLYRALCAPCDDQNNIRRFVAQVFYHEELQILLSVQSKDLETLVLFLRHCIRKQEGVVNTNTLISTLFTYLAPVEQIISSWKKEQTEK
ncbi:MAG: hypothetical protein ACTSW4_07600 [Candidatus Ranarchaeia archaeon]